VILEPINKISTSDLSRARYIDVLYWFATEDQTERAILAEPGNEQRKEICHLLATIIVETMFSADPTQYSTHFSFHHSPSTLSELFKSIYALGDADLLMKTAAFVAHAAASLRKGYPVDEAIYPAVEKLHQWLGPKHKLEPWFYMLYKVCYDEIRRVSGVDERQPTSPSMGLNVAWNCHCNDCQMLLQFVRHPTQTSCDFKLSKPSRKHIRTVMGNDYLGIDSERIGRGSAKIVRIKKNMRSVESARKERAVAVQRLQKLHEMGPFLLSEYDHEAQGFAIFH
jgi:hypothetical protein